MFNQPQGRSSGQRTQMRQSNVDFGLLVHHIGAEGQSSSVGYYRDFDGQIAPTSMYVQTWYLHEVLQQTGETERQTGGQTDRKVKN